MPGARGGAARCQASNNQPKVRARHVRRMEAKRQPTKKQKEAGGSWWVGCKGGTVLWARGQGVGKRNTMQRSDETTTNGGVWEGRGGEVRGEKRQPMNKGAWQRKTTTRKRRGATRGRGRCLGDVDNDVLRRRQQRQRLCRRGGKPTMHAIKCIVIQSPRHETSGIRCLLPLSSSSSDMRTSRHQRPQEEVFCVIFSCFKKRGRARHFFILTLAKKIAIVNTKSWRVRIYVLFTYYLVITPTTCRQPRRTWHLLKKNRKEILEMLATWQTTQKTCREDRKKC